MNLLSFQRTNWGLLKEHPLGVVWQWWWRNLGKLLSTSSTHKHEAKLGHPPALMMITKEMEDKTQSRNQSSPFLLLRETTQVGLCIFIWRWRMKEKVRSGSFPMIVCWGGHIPKPSAQSSRSRKRTLKDALWVNTNLSFEMIISSCLWVGGVLTWTCPLLRKELPFHLEAFPKLEIFIELLSGFPFV